MATTTRPFHITTTAPTTAAEARALADELAEQESALGRAQREARTAAAFATAEEILATDAVEAANDRDTAVAAWQAAAADPAATLEELLTAFVTMKAASATRAAIVAQASSVLDQIKPLRNPLSGQPQAHRHDTIDYLATATFADALEDVVRARVETAASSARHSVQTRSTDAGEQAADKVKV